MLENNEEIYAYTRTLDNEKLMIICNFTAKNSVFKCEEKIEFKERELLISNYDVDINEEMDTINLKPYESRIYKFSL